MLLARGQVVEQGGEDGIGPAEACLVGVIAVDYAAADIRAHVDHIVLLHDGTVLLVLGPDQREKALRNTVSLRLVSVAAEAAHRDPLERRPTVRSVPLVAAMVGAGLEASGFFKQ